MNKYYFTFVYILYFVTTVYCSKLNVSTYENVYTQSSSKIHKYSPNIFLTGKDTRVWFIESNPRDAESPKLQEIPDALNEAGLIQETLPNQNFISSNENDISVENSGALYLEILVVVDFGLYKKIGESVKDALTYVISFWNGVDLRYNLISSPRMRINIAGIILAKDQNALYFIQQSKNERGHVIANKVIFEEGKYFLYEKQIENYDITVVLTTENICSMSSTGVCYYEVVGLSLLGKVCHSSLSTAVIEDNGGFSGIIPATHEIAHLLNVPHDGTGEAWRCSAGDGYIMAPSASTGQNNMKWSQCSKNIFQKYYLTNKVDCLRNRPVSGTPVSRILPGKLLSLEEQCTLAGYGLPCDNGRKICNALSCKRMGYCDADGPAAEGSSCGVNLFCRDGECVPEN